MTVNTVDRSRVILKNNVRVIPDEVIILENIDTESYPIWSDKTILVKCPVCRENREITIATINRTERTVCSKCVNFINNNSIWYGDKFGKLTVIGFDGIYNRNRRYICRCECGDVTTIWASSLHRGAESCGCARIYNSGPDHFAWRGGDYPRSELYILRRLKEYKIPRREWYEYNHKCQACGTSDRINAHHLWHVSTYTDLACDFSLVVPLCEDCHKEFHSSLPGGNHYPCTPHDYYEWIMDVGAETRYLDWKELFK